MNVIAVIYTTAMGYLAHFAGQWVVKYVSVVTTPLLSILEAVFTVSPKRQ